MTGRMKMGARIVTWITWVLIGIYHTPALVNVFPSGWVSTNPTHVTVVWFVLIVQAIALVMSMMKKKK